MKLMTIGLKLSKLNDSHTRYFFWEVNWKHFNEHIFDKLYTRYLILIHSPHGYDNNCRK